MKTQHPLLAKVRRSAKSEERTTGFRSSQLVTSYPVTRKYGLWQRYAEYSLLRYCVLLLCCLFKPFTVDDITKIKVRHCALDCAELSMNKLPLLTRSLGGVFHD